MQHKAHTLLSKKCRWLCRLTKRVLSPILSRHWSKNKSRKEDTRAVCCYLRLQVLEGFAVELGESQTLSTVPE